jgi:RimJ/RimL family protein N-acetyltransferase
MRPPEVIETERLVLRPPVAEDAQAIFDSFSQDREVTRFLTWRPHENIQRAEQFVERCIDAWQSNELFPWAVVLKGKDKPIGIVELRPENFKVEFGYVLARAYWGQGIMTEAVRHVMDWALSQPEIYRVWAVCDIENIASARVLEKAGMKGEGILRRYMIHPNLGDEPRDCYCYAAVK